MKTSISYRKKIKLDFKGTFLRLLHLYYLIAPVLLYLFLSYCTDITLLFLTLLHRYCLIARKITHFSESDLAQQKFSCKPFIVIHIYFKSRCCKYRSFQSAFNDIYTACMCVYIRFPVTKGMHDTTSTACPRKIFIILKINNENTNGSIQMQFVSKDWINVKVFFTVPSL